MNGLSDYSDEELEQIINKQNLSDYSDEELQEKIEKLIKKQNLSDYSDEELQEKTEKLINKQNLSDYSDEKLQKKTEKLIKKRGRALPFGLGGVTEEQWRKYPLSSAIAQTVAETTSIPLSHFINQALMNYPRQISQEMGYEYPEAQTPFGKGLAQAAGIVGGIGGLGPKLAGLTGAKLASAAGTGLSKRVIAGTLSGAVTGGLYGQPMRQRPFSALKGAGIGGISGIAAGIFRNMQKISQLRKGLKQIKADIGAEDLPISETPRKVGEAVSDLRDTLKQSSQEFDNIMETEALQNAKGIKPKLINFGERLTSAYGNKLDSFDDEINKINRTAYKGDVGELWFKSSLEKVSDDPLAVSKLEKFARDRGYQVTEYIDDIGNKTYSIIPSAEEINNPVSFKELVNWKNMFKEKNLSASAKAGTGYKKEDMAYKALMDGWGEFLDAQFNKNQPYDVVSQQFTQLQSEYAPLAQAKWKAYKIFKPFDPTDINIDAGAKFFKDYAIGKAKAGQEELLRLIEQGGKLSGGIGDVSSKIKALGNAKIQNEKQLTEFIDGLLDYQIKIRDMIAQERQLTNQRNNLLKIIGYSSIGAGAIMGGRSTQRRKQW